MLEVDTDFNKLSKKQQRDFLKHLELIQARGFELQESEITKGVTDLAVPVGSFDSGVISVLAISSLTSISEDQSSADQLIVAINEVAGKITASIGASKSF